MATTRERLHEILDLLRDDRLEDAETALTPLLDPAALAFLNAPEDDEETTEEDVRALDEARAEYERGETISLDEAMAELSGVSRSDRTSSRQVG
jgi:hypothetical protein